MLLVGAGNDIAAFKLAHDICHAHGQQAFALLDQRPACPVIKYQLARQAQMIGHPLLACRAQGRGGAQLCANGLAHAKALQHPFFAPGSNNGRGAATGGALCGQHLGQHAAGADMAAGAAGHFLQSRIARRCQVNETRIRVAAWIAVIKSTLVGQDDQRVRFDQIADHGAQRVVIAQSYFICDHGIVFVDDRNHTQLQELENG